MPQTTTPLDLDVPRGVGALLRTTLALFGRHSGLFLSTTLLVVAPVTMLVNGVWEGGLTDGHAVHSGSLGAGFAAIVATFVMPVLVTALHATIVRTMGAGRVPGVGQALRAAAPRFPPAVGAVLWYTILGIVGICLFVVPGIWVLVGGYFAAQIAVLEHGSPFDAVVRSVRFVRGRWWSTAGTLLAGWLAWTVAFTPLDLAIGTLHPGVLYVSLLTISAAAKLSLSALFGTLLYFSLRAADRDRARSEPPLVAA